MPKLIHQEGLLLNFFLATMATAVTVLFGLFKLINLLDIRFYLLYSPKTVNIVVFSPTADLSIWIVSLLLAVLEMLLVKALRDFSFPRWTILPFLLLLASLAVFQVNEGIAYFLAISAGLAIAVLSTYYCNGYLVTGRKEAASIILSCVAGLLILFEIASASSWIFNLLAYEAPFRSSWRWIFPTIDLHLFNVLYPLTPWLFLLFLYSWIWIPALKRILPKITTLKRAKLKIEKISSISHTRCRFNIQAEPQTLDLRLASRVGNRRLHLVLPLHTPSKFNPSRIRLHRIPQLAKQCKPKRAADRFQHGQAASHSAHVRRPNRNRIVA